jgi:uncharacterized membrane protein YdjX (TVP38/TMEM64 family)
MGQLIIDILHGSAHLGVPGLVIFGAGFVVISLTFVPRPPACVAAGLVYGVSAFPLVLVSSTLGAVAGFVLARGLLRAQFRKAIEQRPSWRRVVDAIDSQGWTLLLLLRLASPVPGSATTYIAGLTSIRAWPYTTATFLGLAPQSLLFVLLGAAGPAALGGSMSTLKLSLMTTGLVTTGVIIWQIGRRLRASLSSQLEPVSPPA